MPSPIEPPDEQFRILLVDDEPENLDLYRRILASRYEVITAQNGEEALAELVNAPCDLVICDQRMPGLAGAVVLEHVRALCPDARRMIVSAYAAADDLLDAINRGEVERYLIKPFDPGDLLGAVAEILSALSRQRIARAELLRLRNERERLRLREEHLLRLNSELHARLDAAGTPGSASPISSVASTSPPVAETADDDDDPIAELPAMGRPAQATWIDDAKVAMTRELRRAARYGRPMSLILVRFGPPLVSAALVDRFAQLASAAVRELDIPARLDDQSLVVLLPETDREGAQKVTRRFLELAPRAATDVGEPRPVIRHAAACFPADGLGLWGLLAHAGRSLE